MTHNISQQHLIIIYAIYSRSIGYIGFDFRFSGQAQENKLWQFHTRQYSGKTEILNGGWTAQFPSRPLATLTRTPGLQMRCRYLFRFKDLKIKDLKIRRRQAVRKHYQMDFIFIDRLPSR